MRAIADVAKDALELPASQRLALVRILLDLTENNSDPAGGFEAEWEDEICRRMEAVDMGSARSRPVDEVFEELDQRFPS